MSQSEQKIGPPNLRYSLDVARSSGDAKTAALLETVIAVTEENKKLRQMRQESADTISAVSLQLKNSVEYSNQLQSTLDRFHSIFNSSYPDAKLIRIWAAASEFCSAKSEADISIAYSKLSTLVSDANVDQALVEKMSVLEAPLRLVSNEN